MVSHTGEKMPREIRLCKQIENAKAIISEYPKLQYT